MNDPEEQIMVLVEHLHQPDRLLGSVAPVVTKEGAARILHLTPIAFKYDMQGDLSFNFIWRCLVLVLQRCFYLKTGPIEHPCLRVLNKVAWNAHPSHTSEPVSKKFYYYSSSSITATACLKDMQCDNSHVFTSYCCGPCGWYPHLASKSAGTLRQIENLLAAPWQVNRFMSHNENGIPLATWAFACRYHLTSVLDNVEAVLLGDPLQMLRTREEAAVYAASLPASSVDVGCGSLMRMLHSVTVKCSKEVQAVTALYWWKNEIRETVVESKHTHKSAMLDVIDELSHLEF